jgi:hypothetical protein
MNNVNPSFIVAHAGLPSNLPSLLSFVLVPEAILSLDANMLGNEKLLPNLLPYGG